MIHIISGDDMVRSRNKLNEIINNETNITKIDGKKMSSGQISIVFSTNSLFSSNICVVIEYYSKIKPVDEFIQELKKVENNKDIKIVLWDLEEPPVKIKNSFKNASLDSFSFPKVYFNFLDKLTPLGSAESLNILHQVLKTYSPEQILYSIIKRLRQLLVIKSGIYLSSKEFHNMQDWQIKKLNNQSNLWTELQLRNALISYTDLDEKIKTSSLTMDLSSHLDILLISDLN